MSAGRIAVVRALQLGDLLVAVPALRALRRRFPRAEVTLVGLPWAVEFAARFARYVDRFAAFPGWPGIPERGFDARRVRAFFARQRRRGYDLAVQLHGSGTAINPFMFALGATRVAGPYEGARPRELDYAAPYEWTGHEIDRCLRIAALLDADVSDRSLEFPVRGDERAAVRGLLGRSRQRRIAVHAGARSRRRRWPAARFAAVAGELARECGATIVLTGSAREARLTRALATRLDAPSVDLAGRTPLGVLAAVLAASDLVLSNDTGVGHLAVAVGAPSVTVWGDADPERWAPLDRDRHPIVRAPGGIRDVSPSQVLAVARRLLLRAAA